MNWTVHLADEAVKQQVRIIFKPIHAMRTVEVLLVLLRNERTYR
jgi:hypothetical protein